MLISYCLLKESQNPVHEEYFKAAQKVAEMCGYAEHYSAIMALSTKGHVVGNETDLSTLLQAVPETLSEAMPNQLKKKTLVITD